MTIPEWLDSQEATGKDVAHIVLPDELSREEDPEETIFYNEIRECSILCDGDHPFATVERYGNWTFPGVAKRTTAPIRPNHSGGCSRRIEIWPLGQPKCTWKKAELFRPLPSSKQRENISMMTRAALFLRHPFWLSENFR